ncbi:FAD-dependent oxidoreductase [Occultella glacieicola]|uniref:FAD-dependent oxidoreductase n=1 Tax=Occultella glacieicola TaxID=2518684 RepID=A0ABY2E4V7_9MICO|nr:FAD-dependent oxidoreductase [Occultella glacieicola]TDE95055.1 FAD-dependent oxidoreductase [Occultella glacieicola]
MITRQETFQVVVCGGGLAGVSAAVAAARLGLSTVLVQDRPVLGGNSSSEVRVVPRGSANYHGYARETGIIGDLLEQERLLNHEEIFENGFTNSVWDLTMYDLVERTPGLELRLNTAVREVSVADDGRIDAVVGYTASAETETTFHGQVFVDCTGDGVVAALAGAPWRMGTEARSEFDEPHAPLEASDDVMGNSIHIKTKDVGRPVDFTLPDWAVSYDDAAFFYKGGRKPSTLKGGYWWIEIGVPWHTIHDAETIRHELTRHALGVWDWVKNKDPKLREQARTYALDWIGQVPGKRESRRIMGQHLLTEGDLIRPEPFADEIAYGGWNIDLHTPGGLLAATSEPTAAEGHETTAPAAVAAYVGPFGVPLRSLIALEVPNLLMAGRNVSATHVALGSVRVQATTAIMGQAAGTAAAVAVRDGVPVHEVATRSIDTVQQQLLRDGAFLPSVRNTDAEDLARRARVSASSTALTYGAGPKSVGVDGGLANHSKPTGDPLAEVRGQWIAVEVGAGAPGLREVAVCLSNSSAAPRTLAATLRAVDHIWDYRIDDAPALAKTDLVVPPGERVWVPWEIDLAAAELGASADGDVRYVRLDLDADPQISWHRAGIVVPGCLSAVRISSGRMRRYLDAITLSHRIDPPQAAYPASEVLTGVTRPHRSTNLWRSDPAQVMDQWVQLEWDHPQPIGRIELTFAGSLLREYDRYPPGYRDPQTVRAYSIEVSDGEGEFRRVLTVEENASRRRQHDLPEPVQATRLRLVVHATNGDPAAAVAEIRCYVR